MQTLETRSCPECSTQFTQVRWDQKYCQRKCQQRHTSRQRKPRLVKNCKACGTEFIARSHTARYCGGKCAAAGSRVAWSMVACPQCDKEVLRKESVAGRYCSEACRDEHWHIKRECVCAACGTRFSGHGAKYCSPTCKYRAEPELRTANNERAKQRSNQKQELLMLFLMERDGSDCHICGQHVDPTSTDKMMRPSVDHVIPLSKGGTNTPGNVRLAHRRCNISKGNRESGPGRSHF